MIQVVLDLLPQISADLSAGSFQRAAQMLLELQGVDVEREVPAPSGGRIDLVLDGWFALEIDRVYPRRKSLRKIADFELGMVWCRESHVFRIRAGR